MLAQRAILTLWIYSGEQYQALWKTYIAAVGFYEFILNAFRVAASQVTRFSRSGCNALDYRDPAYLPNPWVPVAYRTLAAPFNPFLVFFLLLSP